MQNSETLFYETRNLGLLDRSVRIAIGAAAILAVLVSQNIGMLGWIALIPLLAVYPIITGMVAYDPFYAWIGINTHRASAFSDEQLAKFASKITGEERSSSKGANRNEKQHGNKQRDVA